METLIDLLVHGQDIALPLGREHPVPADAAAVALQRVLTMRVLPPMPSVRATAGLRLVATDVDRSYGLVGAGSLFRFCCMPVQGYVPTRRSPGVPSRGPVRWWAECH